MKNPRQLKKIMFILLAVAVICNAGIFLSFWNLNLKNSDSVLIPLIFLFCGMLCIIFILFLANLLFPLLKEELIDNIPSIPDKNLFRSQQTKKESMDYRESVSNLLKGLNAGSNIKTIASVILKNLAKEFEMVQGMFFFFMKDTGKFHIAGTYAYIAEKDPSPFVSGEGLSGQAASDRKMLILKKLPDSYPYVQSGLGKSKASALYIIPVIHEDETIGIIEMSTFRELDEEQLCILNLYMKNVGNEIIKSLK